VGTLIVSEYWLILTFVCGPLLGILIMFLVRIARSPGRTAAFPDFSIFIEKLDRGEATRVYLIIGDQTIEFDAQVESGDGIRVQVPLSMPEQTRNEVVPKLTQGLKKLRYKFMVEQAGRTLESSLDSRTS